MPAGRERQADVGRADHLAGERAERLADLGAEHRPADAAHHLLQRAGQRACSCSGIGAELGHRAALAGEHRAHRRRRPWPATGSTSSRHAGRVASTHSARLQALADVRAGGERGDRVEPQSASRIASSDLRRARRSLTDRSPAAATACRATSRARSQLTGPPWYDSSCPSCGKAAPRSPGRRRRTAPRTGRRLVRRPPGAGSSPSSPSTRVEAEGEVAHVSPHVASAGPDVAQPPPELAGWAHHDCRTSHRSHRVRARRPASYTAAR